MPHRERMHSNGKMPSPSNNKYNLARGGGVCLCDALNRYEPKQRKPLRGTSAETKNAAGRAGTTPTWQNTLHDSRVVGHNARRQAANGVARPRGGTNCKQVVSVRSDTPAMRCRKSSKNARRQPVRGRGQEVPSQANMQRESERVRQSPCTCQINARPDEVTSSI